MTDRELLELAAKAAGIELDWDVPPKSPPWRITGSGEGKGPAAQWSPLTDDGDALRLAVKLGINIEIGEAGLGDVQAGKRDHWACEWLDTGDPCNATRRAIVRAAAEIGKRGA